MIVDWFRTLATINPVSYLIEGVRSLIITGWDREALGLAFVVASRSSSSPRFCASWAFKDRMVRT